MPVRLRSSMHEEQVAHGPPNQVPHANSAAARSLQAANHLPSPSLPAHPHPLQTEHRCISHSNTVMRIFMSAPHRFVFYWRKGAMYRATRSYASDGPCIIPAQHTTFYMAPALYRISIQPPPPPSLPPSPMMFGNNFTSRYFASACFNSVRFCVYRPVQQL